MSTPESYRTTDRSSPVSFDSESDTDSSSESGDANITVSAAPGPSCRPEVRTTAVQANTNMRSAPRRPAPEKVPRPSLQEDAITAARKIHDARLEWEISEVMSDGWVAPLPPTPRPRPRRRYQYHPADHITPAVVEAHKRASLDTDPFEPYTSSP
ncbi:hypothetical protein P7C70_g4571, partial [Phenoliferia sp. Uapishka_3]